MVDVIIIAALSGFVTGVLTEWLRGRSRRGPAIWWRYFR